MRKFPVEMEEYIKSIASGRGNKETAKLVSEHFGIEFSVEQCKNYKQRHKISSGLDGKFKKGHIPTNKGKKVSAEQYEKMKKTMFKKGNIPATHKNVGEYTLSKDGYLYQKVKETGTRNERFKMVHHKIWEEHNGPVPEGMIVSFLDGDKSNIDIENLVLLDRAENLFINQKGLRFDNPEYTKAGIAVAKLNIAINRRKQKNESKRNE